MKKTSIYGILMAILMAVLLISIHTADAYTYDSDIDPKIINSWILITIQPLDKHRILMIYKNPDVTAEILIATTSIQYPGTCVGFSYYKKGTAHIFLYDEDTVCYKEIQDQELSVIMKQLFQKMLGYVGT